MAKELLGRRCIIIPTQSMHLNCIEDYKKTHNGKVPDCGECPYNERVFDIIGCSVSRWGVEKVFLVDEEKPSEKISVSIDNILLVNDEEE